jgi:methanogenic corrinoid protein MtbC1
MAEINEEKKLITLMAELKEEAVLEIVRQQIAEGIDPLAIINLCHKGMVRVGERYEEGRYFISGLIMAGEIMRQVGQMVLPFLETKITNGDSGSIVLGTIEGDIHFIGKDIFKVLVRGYGFTVHDLGVDVPPTKFLAAIREFKPDIVGFSALISAAFENIRETIHLLKKNIPGPISPRACIIGGRVDDLVCKNVGADYWIDDGMEGVRLCQRIMSKN